MSVGTSRASITRRRGRKVRASSDLHPLLIASLSLALQYFATGMFVDRDLVGDERKKKGTSKGGGTVAC